MSGHSQYCLFFIVWFFFSLLPELPSSAWLII